MCREIGLGSSHIRHSCQTDPETIAREGIWKTARQSTTSSRTSSRLAKCSSNADGLDHNWIQCDARKRVFDLPGFSLQKFFNSLTVQEPSAFRNSSTPRRALPTQALRLALLGGETSPQEAELLATLVRYVVLKGGWTNLLPLHIS